MNKKIFRVTLTCILLLGVLLSAQAQSEKREYLTAEELLKTKASQLFVTRRFAEALEEFKALSREYPKDVILKRYVGACLDHLGRDEEALTAFQEAVQLNANDFPSRQYLAKIYMRRGELDKAEAQLNYIAENDKQGTFAGPAKVQLETIQGLQGTDKKAVQAPGGQMSPQEFLKSQAAQFFMQAKYEEALAELEKLEAQYPEDILIKRYKGFALDKLQRYDEAMATFQSGFAIAPDNVALHYSFAQTLLHKKDWEGAEREYRTVIEKDVTGTYKARSQQEIEALKRLQELLKRAKPKKWSVNASAGVEWDSNPTSKSKLRDIALARGPSAWKFTHTAGVSYDVFRKGAWSGRLNYSYYDAFYSNALDSLNTILNSWGANLTYVKMVRGRPLITQLGHTTSYTLVEQEYYSTSFAQSLNEIYSFADWHRIILSEKWTQSIYNREGSEPDRTSRDGFGNVVGMTNNFYLNKQKNFYVPLALELGRDNPQGRNYIKNFQSYRTGLHFPLLFKWEGDVSYKFKDSYYPKYGSPATASARRDEENTLSAGLSRQLTEHWNLGTNYTYTTVRSRDGNYTYNNHTLGFSLSYSY